VIALLIAYILGLVGTLGIQFISYTVMLIYSGTGFQGLGVEVGNKLGFVHRLWLCFCIFIMSMPLFFVFNPSALDNSNEDALRLGILTGFIAVEFYLPVIRQFIKSVLKGVVVKI
jgi:hypothetical protein